jgi:hypothetical protein
MAMPTLVRADPPPVSGSPGLAQGVYGDAGNLELLAPAADHGMWVFWWNADPVDHRQGAAQGEWSGGLHLFPRHHVSAARITQVSRGPDFLEVLAVTAGALHRLHWSPQAGFVEDGVVLDGIADVSAPIETPEGFEALAARADGDVLHLRGDASDYPRVAWRTEPFVAPARAVALRRGGAGVDAAAINRHGRLRSWSRAPGAADWTDAVEISGGWQDVALPSLSATRPVRSWLPVLARDLTGVLAVMGDGGAAHRALHEWGPVDAFAAAATAIDGGRIDVVLRRGTELHHGHLTRAVDGTLCVAPARPLISTLWTSDETVAVHRRAAL